MLLSFLRSASGIFLDATQSCPKRESLSILSGSEMVYLLPMAKRNLHPNHTAVPLNFCRLPDGYGVVKIGVSGAASAGGCGLDAYEKAKELGREIAKQGGIITTGATTGFPMYAAMGAKDECGFSIGFSPAATEREHVETYKLPLDFMDLVVYTGFGYSGRDLLLVR